MYVVRIPDARCVSTLLDALIAHERGVTEAWARSSAPEDDLHAEHARIERLREILLAAQLSA